MTKVLLLLLLLLSFEVNLGAAACPWDKAGLRPWSNPSSWPSGKVPEISDSVIIASGYDILLDTQPPRLEDLTIEAGASLVWGDVDGITIETRHVLVKGALHVGSEDCRFQKRGGVLLYGRSDEKQIENYPNFGRKYLGVASGGQLEIHGQDKLSWTKLVSTVGPVTKDCGLVFDSTDTLFNEERGEGIQIMLWKMDGTLIDGARFFTEHKSVGAEHMGKLFAYVNELPQGLVVAVAVYEDLGKVTNKKLPWDEVYSALELLGAKGIRQVGQMEPYALVAITGSPESAKESWWSGGSVQISGSLEVVAKLEVVSTQLTFVARSVVTPDSYPNDAIFRVAHSDKESPVINLMNDALSWNPGDQIVVASTDFEWRQAEVKTLLPCQECSRYQVKVDGEFQYTHFGEVTFGIDERAEVGLLTRNFRVEGSLEDECYASRRLERELCKKYGRDTFGGHLKILEGATAHIEGMETKHMGQQSIMSTYPTHFHMCGDVTGMYVRQVSTHHSLSRCITIHGTDGLLVSDNVCYLHLGHGIFVEDSVEQNNIITRNLVLGTMSGTLTPADMPREWCPYKSKDICNMLASIWITHPNNIVTDNVAAGSETHGVVFAFSDVPLGPSYNRAVQTGTLRPFHVRYTRIKEFSGNVMHSNIKSGLWLEDRLTVKGERIGRDKVAENGRAGVSRYSARDPPTPEGKQIDTIFSELTFYKNGRFDSWVRCGNIIITNSSYGDSREGYIATHTDSGTICAVKNSIFVGETANKGQPFLWSPKRGIYEDMPRSERPTHYFERSAADDDPEFPYSGVSFLQGPVVVENCYFAMYYNNFFNDTFKDGYGNRHVRPGSAIGYHRGNEYPSVPTSGVKGLKFAYCDGVNDHNYVFHGNASTPKWIVLDGDDNVNFRDYDGSVTGIANTQVVRDRPFLTGPECQTKVEWSMTVCPYNYFMLVVRGEDGVLKSPLNVNWPVLINRDDAPQDVINLEGKRDNKYVMRTNMSYTIRFNNSLGDVPSNVRVKATYGLENGDMVRLALCFPKSTTQFEIKSRYPRVDSKNNLPMFVESLSELDSDTTGKAFFWDRNSGYLYMKLISDQTLSSPQQECPGDQCRDVTIKRLDGGRGPAVCNDNNTPLVAGQRFSRLPPKSKCEAPASSKGLGAHVAAAPAEAITSPAACPRTESILSKEEGEDFDMQGRTTPQYRGCYKDKAGVLESYNRLYASMTQQLCIDRCYYRNYYYAGLTSGSICHCGHMFEVDNPRGDCDQSCTGDETTMCGGKRSTMVFTTGIASAEPPERCGPDGRGVVYQTQCLYLNLMVEEYPYAQQTCLKLGGTLTKIDSEDKQVAVADYLAGRVMDSKVWTGLGWFDDQWLYLDRTPIQGYSNWIPGKEKAKAGRFMRLKSEKHFQWDYYGHWDRNLALCDLPLPWVAPPTTEWCGLDNRGRRVSASQPCLVALPSEVEFTQAIYNCHLLGGVLAPAHTTAQRVSLDKFLSLYGDHVKFWVDGQEAKGKELAYDNRYYPDAQVVSDTDKLGALCLLDEVDSIKDCPTGWVPSGTGSCYLSRGTKTRSFETLAGFCNSGRSHILRIDNKQENQFIQKLLPNKNVWLDLRYHPYTDTFLRSDSRTTPWDNWSKRDPKENLSRGCCTSLTTSDGKWRNKRCNSGSHSVVCEMPAITKS